MITCTYEITDSFASDYKDNKRDVRPTTRTTNFTVREESTNISMPTESPVPSTGGTVFTRWGRITCPNTTGTELVYQGIAAGSLSDNSGGGANYLCVPHNPEYILDDALGYAEHLHGVAYRVPIAFTDLYQTIVPCSICYVGQRASKLMIPAKTTCPSSWTLEYDGYLMADEYNHKRNAVYECVDKHAVSAPVEVPNIYGSSFYHVIAACNTGLPCPPYTTNKVITCVVCTK